MDHSGMSGMSGMSSMPGMSGMSGMSDTPAMSMSDHNGHSSDSMMAMMNTYFVASKPNVPLWFSGWVPRSAGATFGACLGLFILTVGVKLLSALRHQAHFAWSQSKWHNSGFSKQDMLKNDNPPVSGQSSARFARPVVPWSLQRDIPRGILAGIHVALEYFLMLAVMTYNVYFFIAIVLGHAVGETAFGRWSNVQEAHC